MSFSQTEVRGWPSHDCRPIAVLRNEPADLTRRLGITFRDDRDDLDELKYAGLLLRSGDQVLLVRHAHAPTSGTEVYGDAKVDSALLLARFLAETGLDADEVTWHPTASEASMGALQTLATPLRSANQGDLSLQGLEGEGLAGEITSELNEFVEGYTTHFKDMHEVLRSLESTVRVLSRDADEVAKAAAEEVRATEDASARLTDMLGSMNELSIHLKEIGEYLAQLETTNVGQPDMQKRLEVFWSLSREAFVNAEELTRLWPRIREGASATARSTRDYRRSAEKIRKLAEAVTKAR